MFYFHLFMRETVYRDTFLSMIINIPKLFLLWACPKIINKEWKKERKIQENIA